MPMTMTPQSQRCGIVGSIENYTVVTIGDRLTVADDNGVVADKRVTGLNQFLVDAKQLKLGWGVLPDGDEVLYFYDRGDHNFGYALNVHDDRCSEWGTAPFPCDQCAARDAKGGDA